MTQEKQPIRLKLGIVKVGKRQDVPNKPYQKLEFTATTEKTGDKPYQFITFSSPVMDAVENSVGKTIEAEVITDERRVISVFQNGKSNKDISIEAQVAVKAVVDLMVANKEYVPEDILQLTEDWIRKALLEALK